MITARAHAASRLAGGALLGVSAALALSLVGGVAAEATGFVPDPDETTPGRMLTLATRDAPSPHVMRDLSPGDVGYWLIHASHDDASGPATLAVQLAKSGPLADHPRGLRIEVLQCLLPWRGLEEGAPVCDAPGGAVSASPADDLSVTPSDPVALLDLSPDAPHHLLVAASLEDSPDAREDESLHGLRAEIGVGLIAAGGGGADDTPRPDEPLTPTGVDLPMLARFAGILLAALGAAAGVRLLARSRREEAA